MSPPRSYRSSETLDALSSLRRPATPSRNNTSNGYSNDGAANSTPNPTYASFSPTTLSSTAPSATSAAKRRSTILVHQKSPLLLATPPQITRALAYSHPFLLPLNRFTGLITWTTGDPWESFLLLVVFWASVLYGDIVVRMAGPVVLVLILIGGMYGRRFSPLSSSARSEPGLGTGDGTALGSDGKPGKKASKSKNLSVDGLPVKDDKIGAGAGGAGAPSTAAGGHRRNQGSISEITNTRHQKTLDEIVETLKEFTARCNILLEPLLELTDFLSTQRTPTSATTRPALTTLFVRLLLCTPVWFLLTLPPLRIITTQRVVFLLGTLILTWHARVMRVARSILWRSATVRRLLALVTGLAIESHTTAPAKTAGTQLSAESSGVSTTASTGGKTFTSVASGPRESELTKALRRSRGGHDAGVRFTFIIYENQRRWVGLGWTTTLFSYERPAWTDEHNNPVPPRDEFELPEVEDGSNMRWRWVEGSRWRVDGVTDDAVMTAEKDKEWDGPGGRMGWVFYDNKWQNGRRGQDGWGRWTRRRKWYRDAELVEADELHDSQPSKAENLKSSLTPSLVSTDSGAAKQKQATDNNPPPRSPDMIYPGASTSSNNQSSTASEKIPEVKDKADTASISTGGSGGIKTGSNKDGDESAEQDDTISLLSTSSKSIRFSGGGSWRGKILPSSSGPTVDSGRKGSGAGSTSRSTRSRRTSNATMSEDEAAGLGTQVSLALQDAGKEGGSWGIGDEARMGLE